MGKFRQISSELWPLINAKIRFRSLSWAFLTDFLQTLHESLLIDL